MPRLDPADPVLDSVPESLGIVLPDFDDLASPGIGGEATSKTILRQLSGRSFQEGGKIVFANLAQRLGFIDPETMTEVLTFLRKNPATQLAISKAQAEVFKAFQEAIEANVGRLMKNVTGSLPYVGKVIGVIWELATLVWRVVQAARASEKEARVIYRPSTFSGKRDADWFNAILAPQLRDTVDWTTIYEPPGYAAGGVRQEYISTKPLENDGLLIQTGALTENALGVVPGAMWLHRSIEVFRVKQSRSSAHATGFFSTEPGNYLPTPKHHALWLWRHVTEPGPAMYTVDADRARGRWEGYLWALRDWLRTTDALSEPQKRVLVDGPAWDQSGQPLQQRIGYREVFGWGPWGMPYDEKRPGRNYGIDDHNRQATPIGALYRLWARQRDTLATPIAAYVSAEHAAIRGSRTLRGRWEQGRKAILESPDVATLDADLIPDPEYRAEVLARKERARKGGLQLGAGDPKKAATTIVAPVGMPREPLKLAAEPPPTAVPPTPDGRTVLAVLGGLGGLGALGVGAWALRKRRQGRPAA